MGGWWVGHSKNIVKPWDWKFDCVMIDLLSGCSPHFLPTGIGKNSVGQGEFLDGKWKKMERTWKSKKVWINTWCSQKG